MSNLGAITTCVVDAGQSKEGAGKRAQQLTEVAAAWHGSLATMRLPLDPQDPLVTIIATALKPEKVRCMHSSGMLGDPCAKHFIQVSLQRHLCNDPGPEAKVEIRAGTGSSATGICDLRARDFFGF